MYQQPSCAKLGPRTGVTVGVSKSDFDLIRGGGAAGRRGLRLGPAVYLIGWWRGAIIVVKSIKVSRTQELGFYNQSERRLNIFSGMNCKIVMINNQRFEITKS